MDSRGSEVWKISQVSPDETQLAFGGWTFQCLPTRMSIEAPNPALFEQVQDLFAGMIGHLDDVHYSACGINRTAEFKVKNEEVWFAIGDALIPKAPIWSSIFEAPKMVSLSLRQTRTALLNEINVTVKPSFRHHPGILIHTSHHHTLVEPERARPPHGAQNIIAFLRDEWDAACAETNKVAAAIFGHVEN